MLIDLRALGVILNADEQGFYGLLVLVWRILPPLPARGLTEVDLKLTNQPRDAVLGFFVGRRANKTAARRDQEAERGEL